jgi:LCP family protein required for cell wall assembly
MRTEAEPPWVRRLLIAVWTFIAIATAGLAVIWFQAHWAIAEFAAGAKAKVVEAAAPELAQEPETLSSVVEDSSDAQVVLAVGSDRRAGEGGKGRSDTMLLVRIDHGAGTVSMLSLPRDLKVPIPGHGTGKLNAAYAFGGMRLLIKTVREYLGVKVDHFAQVDFGGFKDLVSDLGGVYLPVDGRYLHHNDGTAANNYADIDLRPGYQKLGREKALQFVRFRHLDSDFSRAARQQLFLREVGRQLQAEAGDLGSLPGLIETIAKATTSDISDESELIALARTMRATPPDRINRVVLGGASAMIGGVSYVVTTPAQKRAALRRWAKPARRIKRQRRRARAAARGARSRKRSPYPLQRDGGAGARLARSLKGVDACAPSGLPAGYRWGPLMPARSYELDGSDAGAMWATAGSGRSVLFMFTTWQDPPVLESPSQTIRLAGHDVELFYESGRLRMAAWTEGDTRGWVTNTLSNELPDRALVALARSCLRSS